MSRFSDRRGAPPAWRDRTEEILELMARQQRHAEAEAALRAKYDARAELRSALRAWFAYEYLPRTDPEPGQRHDSMLGTRVGLTTLAKRSTRVPRFYGRTSEIKREPWGTVVHAAVNCQGAGTASRIRKAIGQLHDCQLRQMRNADLRAAGLVLDAAVSGDGILELRCVVTDPVAAQKCAQRAYTGVLVSMDGDEISDVSLVDSPAEFMEKGARDGAVIAKVFTSEGQEMAKNWKKAKKMAKRYGGAPQQYYPALQRVTKQWTLRLPDAVERALERRQLAENEYRASPSAVTKAAFEQADFAVRKATIATSRPIPLIDFLRHGRP